ncbi:uncharacterized protein LAESUDRAFT_649040 [Laetiporus sulphureus 93-53]|uniref:Uncharacterized protein n=1 Tax=Laetiporus sulphureus 93-53 TaxID=1314785 RepID=A0A165F688_9APHY|nr:uncharacterized protein LAESUDRAFT_649040 [Laetiporus sulphureus 93-53]KZT08471.1 hypothetical protein LAESUDRAFT_649040 [Laetiporus sulphureus 93-53]
MTIELASGALEFDSSEVPDPPAISFTNDLDRLDCIWDDSSPSWDNSSPLLLRDRSIALIHWLKLYQYPLKPAAFWEKYSANGKRLPITKISDLLKQARKLRDQELAHQAKVSFGTQFSQVFAYRTGGEAEPRVKSNVSSIARTFEKLQASTIS